VKIEKDPSGQRSFRYDTPSWHHFGQGEGWQYGRCNRCVQHVYATRTPSADTVHCWKVLIFAEAVTEFAAVQEYLVERAAQERALMGKWRRGTNALAVVYAKSQLERDRLKASLVRDFKARGWLKQSYLPYRRGCKAFEQVLGPWREWRLPEQPVSAREAPVEVREGAED
jgi:hypothetical protein